MKPKTEVLLFPSRVTVLDGGTVQAVNVLREQCIDGHLPGVARALAKGYAAAVRGPILLRSFDENGVETRAQTIRPAPVAVREAKRTAKKGGYVL